MNAKSVGKTGDGAGASEDYILIRDEKASGVDGGTFTLGVWRTRDLNVEVTDDGGHASIAANQITLAAGTYKVRARCPAFGVDRHKCKLRNITDNVDIDVGSSVAAFAGTNVANNTVLESRFTIATSKVLELQHRCELTKATFGFGLATSFGVIEVYAIIEFWKEA